MNRMLIALTRSVPPSISNCELTHLEREVISHPRAVEQHGIYENALISAGCTIQRLPPLPDLPDSVFVEDTAVVLRKVAIITRPGAESRRPEVTSVAEALRPQISLTFIEPPGTLDGGDVLMIGSTIYVGDSSRTNADGIRQLAEIASAHGYVVKPVTVSGCLHLKSAVTAVGDDAVLLNPALVDASVFRGLRHIAVDRSEPFAANALLVGENVIFPTNYPETRRLLERGGIDVLAIDADELQKAEGAVTCCSILLSPAKS